MRRFAACLCLVMFVGCEDVPPPQSAPLPPLPNPVAKPTGTVNDRIQAADALAAKGDDAKAITTLEEALLIDAKDRKVLSRLAKLGYKRARAIEKTEPGAAYNQIRQAGYYLRNLRESAKDLTDEEKALTLEILYSEATAHAKSRRVEETTGSLRDLVGAGFKDFERIQKDPYWAEMLAIPQFKKDWDEIRATKP